MKQRIATRRSEKPTQVDEIRKLLIQKVKAMTPEQRFESLVASGIFTAGGKLTARYRA